MNIQRLRSQIGVGFALLLTGCAVNPVTGQREFALMTEAQEIALGRDADAEIVASMGLVEDPELQRFVQALGARMAAESERPHLPWTFRVLDDPVVNAFALPGGYIYVTRGIMAHFSSEAELAGVLGHEIGHVTARHGVQQMSRAQLAQLGLGIGTVLAPELAGVAEAAGAGLGLLFLRYGRDAERQADDLGLVYMTREGYDPREMAATFQMLAGASGAEDGARLPGFLSTHPDPLDRRDRILERIATGEVQGTRVERESYLRRVDGMVFGENPREGFVLRDVFHHPDLAFRFPLPAGWTTINQKTGVQTVAPSRDALMALGFAEGASATVARDAFARGAGITPSNMRAETLHGLSSATLDFVARSEGGTFRGSATFLEHGGRVYRMLGYGTEAGWATHGAALRRVLSGFQPETDSRILGVQPSRVELVRLPEPLTLAAFHARYPSTVPMSEIATLNGFRGTEPLPQGTLIKRVVGGVPPSL